MHVYRVGCRYQAYCVVPIGFNVEGDILTESGLRETLQSSEVHSIFGVPRDVGFLEEVPDDKSFVLLCVGFTYQRAIAGYWIDARVIAVAGLAKELDIVDVDDRKTRHLDNQVGIGGSVRTLGLKKYLIDCITGLIRLRRHSRVDSV